ncbi:hypothetical protein [Methanobrevibacter arboriphilus]|uniref:hypothetical protein n=1 Tax=Methanobrevibacter arboriphilus TaxID=39441 RepID=UPI000ADE2BE0|nr:hypothetical protein [Methanobrevibacter arboriphilus]
MEIRLEKSVISGYLINIKKSGWYLIKVNLNATFTKGYLFGMDLPGNIINGTKIYLVYVENNPQLSITKVTSGYNTYQNYKKKKY